MNVRETLYEAAIAAARPMLGLASPFNNKIARGLAGRRDTIHALQTWARSERALDRPLIWLHAPSVGESLMAQAIIAELREAAPHIQVAFTFFSPSAEHVAARVGADVHGYMPWDVR